MRPSAKTALAIGLGALAVRAVACGFTNVVSTDGATFYLPRIRALLEGDWTLGLDVAIPPGYHLLVALAALAVRDLEIAGQAVSTAAGVLLLPAVYLLGRDIFSPRAGAVAAALGAVQPFLVRYSAECQGDMAYACFFTWAVLFLFRCLRDGSFGYALALGATVAAAYYVRPESMGLLGLATIFLLVPGVGPEGRGLSRRLALGAAAWTAFLALALPNVLLIHSRTGVLTLSTKAGTMLEFNKLGEGEKDPIIGLNDDLTLTLQEEALRSPGHYRPFDPMRVIARDPAGFARVYASNLWELAETFPGAFGVAPALLLALAMRPRRTVASAGRRALAFPAILIFYACVFSVFYTSRRMWVQFTPFLLVWSAVGVVDLTALIAPRVREARALPMALGAAIALTLPQTLRPLPKYGWSWRESPERAVGRILAPAVSGDDAIMSADGKVAFYAGARHVFVPRASFDDLLAFARNRRARLLVLDREWAEERQPELLAQARARLREVGYWEFPRFERGVLVYELPPPPGGGAR